MVASPCAGGARGHVASVLICLGTLASQSPVAAVAGMAVIGFAVIFSGVVSSVVAGATTPLLLSFILPVALPAPAAQIPDRLAGSGHGRCGVAPRDRRPVAGACA